MWRLAIEVRKPLFARAIDECNGFPALRPRARNPTTESESDCDHKTERSAPCPLATQFIVLVPQAELLGRNLHLRPLGNRWPPAWDIKEPAALIQSEVIRRDAGKNMLLAIKPAGQRDTASHEYD
jgi:hypothetical protein